MIGCHREGGDAKRKLTIDHELAHAMFRLNPKYKKSCDRLLTKMGHTKDGRLIRELAGNSLVKRGYSPEVIDDELQAYFSTEDKFGKMDDFASNFKKFKKDAK